MIKIFRDYELHGIKRQRTLPTEYDTKKTTYSEDNHNK